MIYSKVVEELAYDELIVVTLIYMFGISYKRKIRDRIQAQIMNLVACLDFLQQLGLF